MLTAQNKFNPRKFMELRFGYIASRTIGAGVELGFFESLAAGPKTVESLAGDLACSLRGTRTLAQGLQSLGLVSIGTDGSVTLEHDARLYLTEGSPYYLGGMILATDQNWNRWANLADTIRSGTPAEPPIESDQDNGQFFSMFVAGLDNLNRDAAQAVARHLALDQGRVVDLGCGSAVWSRPLAAAGLQVLAVDRESVHQSVTRPYVERAGLLQQYEFRCGNLRSVALEEAHYDVALLGHILHSEGPERSLELLTRVRQALRPGGTAVVAEMVPDEARREDRYGVLFGMNMLMLTERGEVFTRSELEEMLRVTGFAKWHWLEGIEPYPVLFATR